MILGLVIWQDKGNISIYSDITCVIYTYIPSTRLSKKKYGASTKEVSPEPVSEFSSDERGDAEVVESEVVELIDDYDNDEDQGKTESPLSKKRRGEIGRAEKGGYFNEALEKLRYIN